MIERIIGLRFITEGPKQTLVVVQDDELRRFTCNLVDIEAPADAEVQAYMYKPSGLVATCYGTRVDNVTVTVDLTAQMLAEDGTNYFQVKLLDDEEAITSYEVPVIVRRDLAIEAIESEADLTVLEQLIEERVNAWATEQGIVHEVQDIRIGYDGTEYESAGEAVRTQIENLITISNHGIHFG